jgi:sterol desaturase/sphingolipid hydroxylase (fatty acid hydroxylase superfamily)
MEDLARALLFVFAFGAVFVGCMVIEAIYCSRTGRGHLYDFKETLANLATGASYKIVDGIAIALVISTCYDLVTPYGLGWRPELGVISVLATIIFTDLFMYVNHLAQHKIRWFWSVHVTHHSSPRMNLSTALRQNFLNALTGNWVLMWIPLALIGFDRDWVLIAIEANLVYQFFMHSEVFNAPKWWGKVFNTPSHHRVHHGSNPAQIDRNFGGVLIIWDKLFGTFQAEETAGEIRYGVPRMPARPYNPVYLQLHEFGEMFRDVAKYRDPRILLMTPEWVHRRNAPAPEASGQATAPETATP